MGEGGGEVGEGTVDEVQCGASKRAGEQRAVCSHKLLTSRVAR